MKLFCSVYSLLPLNLKKATILDKISGAKWSNPVKLVRQLVRRLVNQVCYTRCQVSFYLWWIGSVLKYFKVPKYYDQDYLKIFFLLSTLPMMIQISGKSAHLAQKCYFYQKLPISKVESFLKSNFWPKSNTQNIAYTKPLNLELGPKICLLRQSRLKHLEQNGVIQ